MDTWQILGIGLFVIHIIWSVHSFGILEARIDDLESERVRLRRILDRMHYTHDGGKYEV